MSVSDDLNEGKKLDRAKKAVATGMTLANIYTAGDIASRAAQGEGDPKRDVVAAASILPGAAGWAATAAHYGRKAYDRMQKEDKDPCWKGYRAYGMKKKGSKMVPNCAPVNEEELEEGNKLNKLKKRDWQDPKKRKKDETNDFDPRRMLSPHNRKKAITAAKHVAEDIEQIDEISQKMKDRYIAASHKEANPDKKQGSFKSPLSARKQWNRAAGSVRATNPEGAKKMNLYKYQADRKKLDEVSAELVGKVHNKRLERGEVPSKTLRNAVRKKWLDSGVGKVKDDAPFEGGHKRSHEKSSTHVHKLALRGLKSQLKEEEMLTQEIIADAFDNIFEGRLDDMRDNFFSALNEKVETALDERKRVIAESYFAQSDDEVEE